MPRVSAPVQGYTGTVGGVAFVDGVYEGDLTTSQLAYFTRQGYAVDEPAADADAGDGDQGDAGDGEASPATSADSPADPAADQPAEPATADGAKPAKAAKATRAAAK